MASNIFPDNSVKFDQLLDDIFRCTVCNMPYNSADGRTPKMLPNCHHTFCLLCLKAIDADQRSKRGFMDCPLCRTRMVPGIKMENLVTNFYLSNFKEVLNRNLTNMSIVSDDVGAAATAQWIKENKMLQIMLKDSLHQPQYVEKLEKIIRFIIKEKALTLEDLEDIWAAQAGKHEAIVKNVHDLLAKLAWDFTPEQLDHLFECFQASWTNATKKQREKLLELIRRLAEDDKDGVMAHKVLNLLWSLAHSDDVPTDIMDQALTAQVKILDYSCLQDCDAQKTEWLDRCVDELKNDKWVLPALKQIKEICCLYSEEPPNFNHAERPKHSLYRHEVIKRLQAQHSLAILVAENLTTYMNKVRSMSKEHPEADPNAVSPDSRFSHVQQVQERLNFLRFLLKDGQLWLCASPAKQIWNCLAENAVYTTDRDACFKWFSQLMGEEPDLDPEINKDFFESNILQLDPCLLTESGMECFDKFFKAVNCKEEKILVKRRAYLMDDLDLIGIDYLWKAVLYSGEEIANRAVKLLKETFTNLGPRLSIFSNGAEAAAAAVASSSHQSTLEVGKFCSLHATKPATYWCQTCICVICSICALGKHSRQSGHFPKRLDKNLMTKMTLDLIDRTSEQLSIVRSTSFQLMESGFSFPIFNSAVHALKHHVNHFQTRVEDDFCAQTSEPILDFHAKELEACRSTLTVKSDSITMDDILHVHKKVSTTLQSTVNNLKMFMEDMEKEIRDFADKEIMLCVKDRQAEGTAASIRCPYCGAQTSECQTDEFGIVESVRRCVAQNCNMKIVKL